MRIDAIATAMKDFLLNSSLNTVKDLQNMRIFDPPLVGVAAASDPMFDALKEDGAVGPRHLSPKEWMPEAETVIAYFLPFSAAVREGNRVAGDPSVHWLYGRIEGEKVNNALRHFLLDYINDKGYESMSPAFDERFAVVNRVSNWSERHVGFVAGLGTFSLNCSFITQQGAAGRLGSVIANVELETTPRYYKKRDENCTHCGACIQRCPAGAVHENGKDHGICAAYLDETAKKFAPRYGCGKCQTGVPCEAGIPG